MRPLALVGMFLSLLLAGASVFSVAETTSRRRAAQDRALEEAIGQQVERVLSSQRQMHAAASQMTVNPDVHALLGGRPAGPGAHRVEVSGARAALSAFRSEALLPLSSACIDRGARPVACIPAQATTTFPSSLDQEFIGLAAAAPAGAATKPFLSPVTLRPTVAYVTRLDSGTDALGVAHFDIDLAYLRGSRMIVSDIPGVHISLDGYEEGHLLFSDGRRAPLPATARRAEAIGSIEHGPWALVASGHREFVAALSTIVAARGRELAAVATATAAYPTLLNSWGAGTIALLVIAAVTFAGSLAALLSVARGTRRELLTDPLTRLHNRRALMEDLPRACQRADDDRPVYLWFFDLNGFKRYNDAFGHLAGDAMLARLGRRLADSIGERGQVYRLGGDEFCALITTPLEDPLACFEEAREALSESGGGFAVTSSAGAVEIPRDAHDPTAALRLADQHMYRDKASGRGGPADLVTAVLHAALAQRHPELDEHSSDVAGDVERLARAVGLDDDTVEMIIRAGDLHDVGKLGIPDEIVTKPGPLNDREWEFMRQHTVMGERIIAAAGPSLEPIAPLVRASHERWDGAGYPDGLAGEEIPLGARIITICDSYQAMLSARPYKPAMPAEQAVAELRRCSGTQFDPQLVEVYCEILTGEHSRRAPVLSGEPSAERSA